MDHHRYSGFTPPSNIPPTLSVFTFLPSSPPAGPQLSYDRRANPTGIENMGTPTPAQRPLHSPAYEPRVVNRLPSIHSLTAMPIDTIDTPYTHPSSPVLRSHSPMSQDHTPPEPAVASAGLTATSQLSEYSNDTVTLAPSRNPSLNGAPSTVYPSTAPIRPITVEKMAKLLGVPPDKKTLMHSFVKVNIALCTFSSACTDNMPGSGRIHYQWYLTAAL